MIISNEFRQDVVKAFDIGHSRYIETANGTNHMYFLLGTDTKTINHGMRCKDYLQEVFLSKKFRKTRTGDKIYQYPLRGVRNATKLFLKWPDRNMAPYTGNVEKCINYINKAYSISISASVNPEYVELTFPINWFTDIINPVQASAICTLLRSCLIWKYESFNEVLDNIDDLEDEYEEVFPEKDWLSGRSRACLEFLGNVPAQKALGSWDNISKAVKREPNQEYHNGSGFVTAFNRLKCYINKPDVLSLIDKMTRSNAYSDQCILLDSNNNLAYDKIITNEADMKRAAKKIKNAQGFTLLFNRSLLGLPDSEYYYLQLKASFANRLSIMTTLGFSRYIFQNQDNLVQMYKFIRLCRLLNCLSKEGLFLASGSFVNWAEDKARNASSCDVFVNQYMVLISNTKTKEIVRKSRLLETAYSLLSE